MTGRFGKLTLSILLFLALTNIHAQTIYHSYEYGFSTELPAGWNVFAETADRQQGFSIIAWQLPPIFDDLEKTDVANYVSVTAYKDSKITDINKLISYDQELISSQIINATLMDSLPNPRYEYLVKQNDQYIIAGTAYFYENNVGYVMTLTASEGTFDSALTYFDDFMATLLFFEPGEIDNPATYSSQLRFDGMYVADISAAEDMTYMYLRFYDDSTVYVAYYGSYSPQEVAAWFNRDFFAETGYYSVSGTDVAFSVSSDLWSDYFDDYTEEICNGKISADDKLFLRIEYLNGSQYDFIFNFVPDIANLSAEEE